MRTKVHTDMRDFFDAIEAFRAEWKRAANVVVTDQTFGLKAARNPNLMLTLRAGGRVRAATEKKVRDFMSAERKRWERAAKRK